ncbi:MAG: NAD(P)/FAD-dependent oxidoreductase [Acidobacteria bacterium]|nr:MAG: NAD(P)/FAD-dependent oxidoreductase [Acidobacteriota bacterium]
MHDIDLAVIGGGPAGLAAAIRAANDGARVVLFEKRRPPIDKACGEGLMPDGVGQLEALGLDPARLGGRPFRGITFADDRHRVDGDFPATPGLGIPRTRLHAALWQAAGRAGVRLEAETTAACRPDGTVGSARGTIRARWVIAADGLHSPTRRALDLSCGRSRGVRRFGLRRHVRIAPWNDRVEVTFADGAEAYVTPLGDEMVGVALLASPPRERGGMPSFDELLARFPSLARRTERAAPEGPVRGAGPLRQRACGLVRGRVALLGDAAGYVDAITGEGISVALHQARELVRLLGEDRIDAWPRVHRRIVRVPNTLCRLVLALARRPSLRARALATLARDPRVFERFLAVHSRDLAVHRIGLRPLLRLAFGLARPV